MQYAYNHIKLTWGGIIYSGEDIFTNGIHLGFTDRDIGYETTSVEGLAWLSAVQDLVSAWFSNVGTGICNKAELKWMKAANIGIDGKYIEEPYIWDYLTTVVGGNTANIAPQLSLALSMQSNKLRGVAKDGRIYPPLTGVPGATGRVFAPATPAATFQTLLTSINALPGFNGSVSPKVILVSDKGTGESQYVTKVRVGNVIDTQRRRRNKFVEEYVTVPVAS